VAGVAVIETQGQVSKRERFEALFDLHVREVHRYVRRRTDHSDVDDIVAEVFLTAWRRFDDIPMGFEGPWLFRTAWNVLANARRKHVDIPFEYLPDTPDGSDVADVVIEDDLIRRAWESLSVRDREVLRLSAWEGLDGSQLAEALGISVGGAGAALFRARERLSAALADD
jgi:RNA polymerase sigma factor (sigma-70 family)